MAPGRKEFRFTGSNGWFASFPAARILYVNKLEGLRVLIETAPRDSETSSLTFTQAGDSRC